MCSQIRPECVGDNRGTDTGGSLRETVYTGKDVLSNVACSVCPGRPMYGGSHMSMLIRDFHFQHMVYTIHHAGN